MNCAMVAANATQVLCGIRGSKKNGKAPQTLLACGRQERHLAPELSCIGSTSNRPSETLLSCKPLSGDHVSTLAVMPAGTRANRTLIPVPIPSHTMLLQTLLVSESLLSGFLPWCGMRRTTASACVSSTESEACVLNVTEMSLKKDLIICAA